MDSSRRAVEAYWRSRMVDGVTSDEDKVAPVYKIEEICELLRTSDAGVVKEVADYVFKRIDHKSPVVKQKALRVIKYAVGKSGVDFRREVQRHSSVIRELFHYRGHPDPLKGDALNKAVRETAHEAMNAIFSNSNDNKPAPTEGVGNRIEGFGNTNYEMPTEDKKSFLSEVVDLGRASIEQGLSSIAAAHSMRKNDVGSYRSPNLRRSLTTERDIRDKHVGNSNNHTWGTSGTQTNISSGTWSHDSTQNVSTVSTNGDTGSSQSVTKSREERLLETIVTSGGVRLQPTRDAIQNFLSEASKLNQVAMCHALELKLQSNLWQVRMKALCVLEAILRKKNDEQFSVTSSYFSDNRSNILKCSDSPQVSLREKASKVLSLLEDENISQPSGQSEESSSATNITAPVPLADLIDTSGPDEIGNEDSNQESTSLSAANVSAVSFVDDLFSSEPIAGTESGVSRNEGDPFADVSFHVNEEKQNADNLFSGLIVGEGKSSDDVNKVAGNISLLDTFSSTSEQFPAKVSADTNDLLAGLSINKTTENKQPGQISGADFLGSMSSFNSSNQSMPSSTNVYQNGAPQMVGVNPNLYVPVSQMQYDAFPGMILNQPSTAQPMNYSAIGNLVGQQQFTFQNINMNAGISTGFNGTEVGGFSSPIPDIFNPSNVTAQHQSPAVKSSKEDTKAFDFISDHLSSARSTKRLV